MKNLRFISFFILFTVHFAHAQNVKVTFVVNSSSVPDTITARANLQLRGNVDPLTWDDATGGKLMYAGGDYWYTTIEFPPETQLQFKIFVDSENDNETGWEANVSTGSTNREWTVRPEDEKLPLLFYNTVNARSQFYSPFTSADSIEVLFRVNMASYIDFNPTVHEVGVRGGVLPLKWGKSILLRPESPPENLGQVNYQAEKFWSGIVKFPKNETELPYQFVITKKGNSTDSVMGEIRLGNLKDNRLLLLRETTTDTTLYWKWFGDISRSHYLTPVQATFMVDMTKAIRDGSFVPGDIVEVGAGYFSSANDVQRARMTLVNPTENIYQATVSLVSAKGIDLDYQYYLFAKNGFEARENYYDFDFHGSPSARVQRRRSPITGTSFTVHDIESNEMSPRRQPTFPNLSVLARDVLVTWECDVRPAIYQVLAGDTLFDIQGTYDIFQVDSILTWGVWINGYAAGGWKNPGGDWGFGLQNNLYKKLYDDGSHGDRIAGDSIFTRQILVSPDSINIGTKGRVGQIYKFGIRGGDNEGGEGGYGNNHVASINDSGPTFTLYTQFGSIHPTYYDAWNYHLRKPTPRNSQAPKIRTNAPAHIGYTSTTLNGEVNPTGLRTTTVFQYDTSTSYKHEIIAIPNPVTNTNFVPIRASLTGLLPGTTYYYRIVATNSAATTRGKDFMFQTSACGAMVILHTPPPSQETGKEIKVTANVSTDCGLTSAILHYRQGGDSSFVTVPMTDAGSAYRWTIPGFAVTPRGIEYFFQMTDLGGRTVRTPLSGFFSHQVSVPNGLVKEEAQPGGTAETGYRLISLPLDLKNKSPNAVLVHDFGDYQNSQWRFYELRDDYLELPANASIYFEYPNTSDIKPGKAFWLIVKEPGKRLSTGAGVSIRTDSIFAIPLHRGWNFVGNPFYFPIPLSKVRLQTTQQSPILRHYEGNWNETLSDFVHEILPFEGYALSVGSPDTLLINPDLADSTNSLSKTSHTSFDQTLQWSIQILAQCQEARDIDNVVAVVPNAENQRDDLDLPEPPVIGEYVSVYFPHREWNTLAKTYCIDARPEPTEGEVWDFEVKTNLRDKVNLSFEGTASVPSEFEVWLVDEALKITQNLRENSAYSVAGSEHPKALKLVVGKREFIAQQLAEISLVPATYELSQNFPNPFNPVTTIRYGLPQTERVTLRIYSVLGEEIATLVNDEQKAPGYHVAIWDGRGKDGNVAASGVYIYRMTAGSFVRMTKLALIK